jgi:hypothetical protein
MGESGRRLFCRGGGLLGRREGWAGSLHPFCLLCEMKQVARRGERIGCALAFKAIHFVPVWSDGEPSIDCVSVLAGESLDKKEPVRLFWPRYAGILAGGALAESERRQLFAHFLSFAEDSNEKMDGHGCMPTVGHQQRKEGTGGHHSHQTRELHHQCAMERTRLRLKTDQGGFSRSTMISITPKEILSTAINERKNAHLHSFKSKSNKLNQQRNGKVFPFNLISRGSNLSPISLIIREHMKDRVFVSHSILCSQDGLKSILLSRKGETDRERRRARIEN